MNFGALNYCASCCRKPPETGCISSLAIEPPFASPAQIQSNDWRCSSTSSQSKSVQKDLAGYYQAYTCILRSEDPCNMRITPTFRNSSRSTRGTTRMTAYSNKCFSGMLCFFYKIAGMITRFDQELFIYFPILAGVRIISKIKPFIRDKRYDRSESCPHAI